MQDKKAQRFVSSIEDFYPAENVTVACFIESLYYVRNPRAILERWRNVRLYVRIYNAERHADCIQDLQPCEKTGCIYSPHR
jgi:hypothetical protein